MIEAVVIGVSSGGLKALGTILPALSEDFRPSVVVVQHRHATADDYLVSYLNQKCMLSVETVEDKKSVAPNTIYIAPPNYHLLIEKEKSFALTVDEPVNYARPSVDVLFESAAPVYGASLIGVILTGANNDGSRGLDNIHAHGGLTIVQDPDTAEVDTMPRAAIAQCEVDYILPLAEISLKLIKLAQMARLEPSG